MKQRAKLSPIRGPGKKPGRPLAIMENLTSDQKKTLFSWFTKGRGMTYAKAQDLIWCKWGIKTNSGQLCRFWQRYCQPNLQQPITIDSGGLFEIVIQIRRKKGEP